jgi:hypothetical protein
MVKNRITRRREEEQLMIMTLKLSGISNAWEL